MALIDSPADARRAERPRPAQHAPPTRRLCGVGGAEGLERMLASRANGAAPRTKTSSIAPWLASASAKKIVPELLPLAQRARLQVALRWCGRGTPTVGRATADWSGGG